MVWGELLPAGQHCLLVPLHTLTPVSPCVFFLIQFFRAFSKKAEDGIRITSECLEPSFGGLFCFIFSLGANGSAVHTPHALGPQGAQGAAESSSLSSAQPMGQASPPLTPWHPVLLQIPVPPSRTCAMPSSPTLSRAKTPGRLPVLHWSQQGGGGVMGNGCVSLCPMECRFGGKS